MSSLQLCVLAVQEDACPMAHMFVMASHMCHPRTEHATRMAIRVTSKQQCGDAMLNAPS